MTDLLIARLSSDDIPGAMELKDALGWNQTPADWQRFLLLAPQGCFKAVAAGRLAGTALAFVFDRVCWIGMVIVAEAFRRRGLGTALMSACLEHSRRQGCRLTVLDATPAGLPLYASLGFSAAASVARAFWQQRPAGVGQDPEGRLTGGPARGKAGLADRALRPLRAVDLPAVSALEARAVGARRDALLRLLLEEYPGCGLGYADRFGSLQGFVLWRPGTHSLQIGPLIAASQRAAGTLLDGALAAAREAQQPPSLIVPGDRPGLIGLLESRGLRVEPRLTRMVLSGREVPAGGRLRGQDELIYAFSGPEKG